MSGSTIFRLLALTVLLFSVQPNSYCQETEEELKEQAAKLFDSEQYVDATSLYLRLLALNPRSHDYNYRYGTCLLYNSNKKQDAFKYLNYSVSDPNVDIQAYYFLGKAHHLNYQFNEAIKNYELYKQKAGSKIKASLELDRQIEMCQNGKRLLTTITDIIVLEKKEIEIAKFFRLYNLQDIGGDLLVAADFQSKVDKKKGHTPLIHLSPDASVIYYSSYGDSDNGQKDIYLRKRLPDGTWGLPQLIPGNVNTKYDEDFPYMHPSGEYLYFCSKGHNSMGGYDIFRSKLNQQNNAFGPPENLDFAISSPDNDLFYVVDSLDNNAYFASSRQSANGKMFVYKVRVERVPLQLAVIKGNFGSTINPDSKKLSITVTDANSGEKIGTFATAENGSYLITLPKGGKYVYEMKVDGKTEVHRYTVTVPFSKVFRPLKQKIVEELAESSEVVRVIDQFNDEVDDPMGVLAEVIKQRSELNPNANQFDLKELDNEKENQRILAELGFSDPSPQAVVSQFEKLENKQQEIVQQSENLANGALTSAMNKLEEAGKHQERAKSLVNQANNAETKAEKFDLFKQAKAEMEQATKLKIEAKTLMSFSDSVQKTLPAEKERLATIENVTKEVKTAVSDGNTGDLKDIIGRNTGVITSVSEAGANDPTAALLEQKTQLKKEKTAVQAQKDNYATTATTLEKEIASLQASLPEAKKKDQPAIQSAIDSKTQELALVRDESNHLDKKLETIVKKEESLDKRIAFLNDVTQVNETTTPALAIVQSRLAEVDTKNNNTLASYINQQVTEMEKDPSLAQVNDPVADNTTEQLREDYESEIRSISSQAGLSEKDKTERLIKADTDYLASVEEELDKTEAALQQNPSDEKAQQRKTALNEQKTQAEARVAEHRQELATLNLPTGQTGVTPETELAAIDPDYEEKINQTKGSEPKAGLEAQNAIDEELLTKIEAEQKKVDAVLAENPSDAKAQQRKEALNKLETAAEERVSDRREAIRKLNEPVAVTAVTPESELEKLLPSYQQELDAAQDPDLKAALEAQNAVDNRLLEKVDLELAKTEQALQANPSDKTAADRQKALTALKSRTEEMIADREKQLRQLDEPTAVAISPEAELENLVPDYEEQLAAIDQSDKKTALEQANRIDGALIAAINSELEEVESQLLRNPENEEAIARKDALNELKQTTEERVAERATELESLQPEPVNALAETTQKVRPDYEENKQRIASRTPEGREREVALLKEDQALLSDISEAVQKADAKAQKNPEDQQAKQELEQLREAESIQEAKVNERQLELIAAAEQQINKEVLQAEIAPQFDEEMRNSEQLSESERETAVQSEQNLQAALEKRLKANEKQLQKGFDPEVAAENKVIASLIHASQSRVESFNNPSPENPNAVALIENDLGDDAEVLMHSDPQTIAEAKRIITELKEYDNQLDEQLENLRSEDPLDEQAVADKEAQQAIVRRRIGIVEADLDAMESYVIAGSQENTTEKELVQLSNRENELQQQIASGQLDKAAQRAAEKELKTVQADKQAKEQQVLADKHEQATEALQPLKIAVEARSEENELARSVEARSEELTSTPAAEKDPETLREQVGKDQEALTLLDATNDFLEVEDVYAEKGIVIVSTDELEDQKRRFSIEIGQLEAEISSLRKDPAQTAKVAELERQQRALKAAVLKIDEMIATSEASSKVDNPIAKGLDTPVSFDEEQTIAATPAYAALLQQQDEVKTTQRQLNEVIRQKESVRREIAQAEAPAKKDALVQALSTLEEEQKTLQQELHRQQDALETAIKASGQNPEKVKNLLARDVPVTKPVQPVVSLPESMKTGFEIVDNPTPVRTEKAIPVDLKAPSGLVYRVQVGAYAKALPENLFTEFTPVTGEKLANGITRYLAGYFGNRNRAKEAQLAIRDLGYSDAFIVAYCDGERITLAEARRLEDAGLCIPKNQDSLMLEVVENTLAQLPADSVAKLRPEVKKSDYNKAPGAVAAEAVEDRKGLFFTVQVGVYNRPATKEQLRSIDPLITKRLENGQIRYSSGIFQSVEAARPKRIEAITRGITDAFITAYYKGERISLTEAKRLLAELGEDIVEKTQVTELQPDLFQEAREYAATQPQPAGVIEKQPAQIVSDRQYETYPAEELSRYNTYGSFYYDAADKRIKSIVYSSADALPELRFLGESVDTVFQKSEIGTTFELQQPLVVAEWDKAELEGAFADWLLRLTIPHRGEQTETGFRVVFEEVPAENRDELIAQLQSYGAAMVKLEEE